MMFHLLFPLFYDSMKKQKEKNAVKIRFRARSLKVHLHVLIFLIDLFYRIRATIVFIVLQFSSVQSLSCVWLFATPWTAAHQASLSISNSWSSPKPMSIESVMPSNHLILCRPLLLLLLGRKVMTNLDSILKTRDITLSTKVRLVKAMVFPVVTYGLWELDYKESLEPKNWCFWTMVLEKILESPLDCKEIQPVHPEGNQSWIFIGRTEAEAETPILWPPDAKSWLIWKDPDAEKDWGQEEKGTTEDEMVGWHHRLNGHEFE